MSAEQREIVEPFTELVYDAEARPWFAERWPEATFTDASDSIHDGRFEVSIPGVTSDDVYPEVIAEGWSGVCLGFELCLRMSEHREDVRRWIDRAKDLIEAADIGRHSHPDGPA